VNDFITQVLRLITAWFNKAQKLIPLVRLLNQFPTALRTTSIIIPQL